MKEYRGELEEMQEILVSLRGAVSVMQVDSIAAEAVFSASWVMGECIEEQIEAGKIGHTELSEHISALTILAKSLPPEVREFLGRLNTLKTGMAGVIDMK